MRFALDKSFRSKISALAKTAEGLKLEISEIDKGRFLVFDSKRGFHVTAAVDAKKNEIDVSCECETFEKTKQPCVHIAFALKKKYDPSSDAFDLPDVGEMLERIMALEKKDEEKEAKEVKKVEEIGQAVQKLISEKDEEIAKLADELDFEQIVISLSGEYKDLPMIYEFRDKEGHSRVVVSWNGYIKAARLQGNIRVEFLGFEKHGDKIIAKAKAIDLKRNIEIPAVASRIPKHTEFSYEILASKAIRNALKKVIDPDILARVIEHAKKMQSVRELQLREIASP